MYFQKKTKTAIMPPGLELSRSVHRQSLGDQESISDISSGERIDRHINKYYRDSTLTTNGFQEGHSRPPSCKLPVPSNGNGPVTSPNFTCKLCNNKSGQDGNFILLSCNHVFHVHCLAENHFSDIMKYSVIDNEYFNSRKCPVCLKQIETEELAFLHRKFQKSTV